MSQYAQDYIGQLCRAGSVDCRRVNGLWYVTLESLENHKVASAEQKAQAFANTTAAQQNSQNDVILDFSGEEYISSKRGAEMTGYNQDYVTQLARSGKVKARQVGSRWYVGKKDLMTNKEKNDALLAAVQARSAGVAPVNTGNSMKTNENWSPTFQSHQDENHLPLMPNLLAKGPEAPEAIEPAPEVSPLPIRTSIEPSLTPSTPVGDDFPELPTVKILDLKAYHGANMRKRPIKSGKMDPRLLVAGFLALLVLLGGGFFLLRAPVADVPVQSSSSSQTQTGLIDRISHFLATKLEYRRSQ